MDLKKRKASVAKKMQRQQDRYIATLGTVGKRPQGSMKDYMENRARKHRTNWERGIKHEKTSHVSY